MGFIEKPLEVDDTHQCVQLTPDGTVRYVIDVHGQRTDFEWKEIDSSLVLVGLTTCSGRKKQRVEGNVWISQSMSSALNPVAWYGDIVVRSTGAYTLLPDLTVEDTNFRAITFSPDGTVSRTLLDGSRIVTYGACGEILERSDPRGFTQRFEWDYCLNYLRLKRVLYCDGTVMEKIAETRWVRIGKTGHTTIMNVILEVDKLGLLNMRRAPGWQLNMDLSEYVCSARASSRFDELDDFSAVTACTEKLELEVSSPAIQRSTLTLFR
ncbi:MAG TPA: hypothetical protein V6C89_21370 [Drouetiella sp.]